jgi:transcriptional regulator with XRE-family HTH domain
MNYLIEPIARSLKAARQRKGLSQRELSAESGIPQGHISRIESGVVDLRVSTLVELARFLDLEVMLVPRKMLPAVQSIVRREAASKSKAYSIGAAAGTGSARAASGEEDAPRAAYNLDDDARG